MANDLTRTGPGGDGHDSIRGRMLHLAADIELKPVPDGNEEKQNDGHFPADPSRPGPIFRCHKNRHSILNLADPGDPAGVAGRPENLPV